MEKNGFKILLETMYELYEQGMYRVAYGVLHNKEQAVGCGAKKSLRNVPKAFYRKQITGIEPPPQLGKLVFYR